VTDKLKGDLGKAEGMVAGTARNMDGEVSKINWNKVGLAATAAAGVMAAGFAKATAAASDLEETTAKFYTVFERQERKADEFTKVLTAGYAMSTRESRKFLGEMQDLLVPMGMNSAEAANLSFEIVKLPADLGSFNNLPTAQVMGDIQSALVGNYETMKKYGVVLNATIVQEKALEMGLAETKKELDASDKAFAAYKLIIEGSTFAMGDMARTADGYANTLKKNKATIEDFWGHLGALSIPIAAWGIEQLTTAVEFYADKLGLTMTGFREEHNATYTGLIKDAEGYDSYVEESSKRIAKAHEEATIAATDNWSAFHSVVDKSTQKMEDDNAASWAKMKDNWNYSVVDMIESTDDFAASWDEGYKDISTYTDDAVADFTAAWEEGYKYSDGLINGRDGLVAGVKRGFEDIRDYSVSMAGAASDLVWDIRGNISDTIGSVVDDLIDGTASLDNAMRTLSDGMVGSLGDYATKMFDKVFDTLLDLIIVNVGLGAAESGASKGWAGAWAALGEIGIYMGSAGAAILAAKSIKGQWAEGGWIEGHP